MKTCLRVLAMCIGLLAFGCTSAPAATVDSGTDSGPGAGSDGAAADAGRDAGRDAGDTGAALPDTGTDTGTTVVDAGSDAGVDPIDSGADLGTPAVDLGTPAVDMGTPAVDMGTDAGMAAVDMGTVADSGPRDAGAGDAGPVIPQPAAAGALVITEIMYDTAADPQNEWIEVFNPGTAALNLEGCTVSDSGATQRTIDRSGAGLIVMPGAYVTLAWRAVPGLNATHVLAPAPSGLSSNGDSVVVRCGAPAIEIDRVDYLVGTMSWPATMQNASMALSPASLTATANDTGANWCRTGAVFDATTMERGSPNAVNPACPAVLVPNLTSLTPPNVVRGVSSLTINGTNLAGATSVTIGGTTQTIMTNTATQIVIATVAAATALGAQPVIVNAGAASNSLTVTVLDRVNVAMAAPVSATSVNVVFTRAVDPATVTAASCTINGGLTVSAAVVSGAMVTLTTTAQTAGQTYTVTCANTITDTGMVASGTPNTATFIGFGATGPVIASVDYPVITRGGRLRLTGTNFTGATAVTIGGTTQTFTVGSATQLTIASVANGTPLGAQPVVVTGASASAPFSVTVIDLVINELDADTAGNPDMAEFVEVWTGLPVGLSTTDLTGYALVFYNGNGDVTYRTVPLTTAGAAGYFVAGNAASSTVTFPNDTLQNGQDAVALYQMVDGATVANATPIAMVTAPILIDAVVYDTADPDATVLLDTLLGAGAAPGRVQVDEATGGNGPTNAVQRCGAGRLDGRRFTIAAPTPGAVNTITTCP